MFLWSERNYNFSVTEACGRQSRSVSLARKLRVCCSFPFSVFESRKEHREKVYCWFSVSRHIKIKSKPFNRLSPESGKYTKTLTKIQVTATFPKRDMRRNFLSKFIQICMETPCLCPSRRIPTWQPETNRNICH